MPPSDKRCEAGQQRILTEKTRDKHDTVVVQEKLDGSCCSVAKIDGHIYALTRSGYEATTSKYEQHHLFNTYVNGLIPLFVDSLSDGERLVGEWLAQAHGVRYRLPHDPFVVFDLMREHTRIPYQELIDRLYDCKHFFTTPRLIHYGGALPLDRAISAAQVSGHGAIDPTEGVVYRCERDGKVDFLAKWVRPDKVDGCYLPEISGKDAVWNLVTINSFS